MKKKHLNIVLALVVVVAGFLGNRNVAQAETQTVEWSVSYTGSDITSTYDSAKSSISNTMPGDTIQYVITYNNDSSEAATFYMSADVVKTLEEGAEASGGAYSYTISTAGSSIPIFDSKTVGGDATSVVGLNQVNGKEGAYFSLGSVEANSSGTVTVSITLDGNSQTNSYMATLGQLQFKFGAEQGETIVKNEKKTIVNRVVKTLEDGTQIVIINDEDVPLDGAVGAPRTGDSILPIIICGIALLVGVFFILWYFRLTKNNKEAA